MANARKTGLHSLVYRILNEKGPMTARQLYDTMFELRFRSIPESTKSLANMLTKSILYDKEIAYVTSTPGYSGGMTNMYKARTLEDIRDRIVMTNKSHDLFPKFIIEILKEKEMLV
tara:strand:+ start:106 stop:453 length:348 start_codon:yes stop_codon:yes gene_type:complete